MPLIQGDEKIETINSLDDQGMLTERLTDKAISFIEKNKSNPFFLYLAHPVEVGIMESAAALDLRKSLCGKSKIT